MKKGGARATYANRADAGRVLAVALRAHPMVRDDAEIVVLGLARGGVPVAAEVAGALDAHLDVLVVRKLGVPAQPELAFGAVTERFMVINEALVRALGITGPEQDQVVERERRELARRTAAYRGDRPMPVLAGKTVILVDDGVATGASMHVAVLDAKRSGAQRVIVGVPTAPAKASSEFGVIADAFICPLPADESKRFVAVGISYIDFTQVNDDAVRALLHQRDMRD